jgi:O-antigen/teichoic acid export membrane protein
MGIEMTLRGSATKGIRWSSASQFGRQTMQLVTTAVLARLLSPADFGLIGMATLVIGFISLFKDLGTCAAVIQRKEVTPRFLSSIFWANAAFGLVATAILYLLAPAVALFYKEPRLVPVLQAFSLTFVVSGLSILQQALLEREMAFDKLAKLELAATLLGTVVGITAAVLNCGVWSLVLQSMTVAAATTVLLWAGSKWRPSRGFCWEEIRSVSSYSGNLTGFSILNYFVRNADYLLIGKFLGAQQLGYYTLAYRLMLYPLQSITAVISRVMFPAFSQIKDDDARFSRIYLKMVGFIAFITFPMMLGLMTVSEPFVLVFFGDSWRPVALLLLILAPVGMLQSVGGTVGMIYQARGRTDWMFRWGLVTGVCAVTAFAVGINWGITGVAVAYSVFSLSFLYPNFAIPFRLLSLPMLRLLAHLWRPLCCGMLMVAAVCSLKALIPAGLPNEALLATLIPFGILVYVSASFAVNREIAREMMNTVKGKA